MLVVARERLRARGGELRPTASRDSGGISDVISERPIMSAAAKPVVCSAARLKRSIRGVAVGDDHEAARGLQDGIVEVARLAQRRLRPHLLGDVGADAEIADRVPVGVAFDGQPLRDAQAGAVLAHVGQLPALGLVAGRAGEKDRPFGLDRVRGELVEVEHRLELLTPTTSSAL